MKLIDPGIGELSDRLTILALKILFGTEAGKDVSHFVKEQTSILAKLRSRDLNGAWFTDYTDLAVVNAALWHAEDDLRALRDGGPKTPTGWEEIGRLAMRIQSLNDDRALLVGRININTGDTSAQEKVHAGS